jgi:P4 family phage/plasmid primase-like protien
MVSFHEEKLQKASAWYGAQGWKILPCYGLLESGKCTCGGAHTEPKDKGKHPAIGDWNSRATDDKLTIQTWWENSPENNIGVVAQKSGFLVVDIDPRSGGIDSYEKFLELLDHDLPNTVEQLTGIYSYNGVPQRGRHIFLKCDEDEKLLGNLKSLGLPGIDIKHNGYVLLSPSRHASGVDYEWVEGKAPWQIRVADAPENLLNVIRKGSRRGAFSTSMSAGEWGWMSELEWDGDRVDISKMLDEGINEGSRAVDLYKLACALSNKIGVDSPEKRLMIETTMIRFNHEKVRPPMNLEGPNGVLMHTRRAMDFVAENPITYRMYPELEEWANKNKLENEDVSRGSYYQAPKEITSTSDPDDIEDESNLEGTLGGDVSSASKSGLSIFEAFSSGNIDVPKDPDAISSAEGGKPGQRSLSDTGNGRRLIDTFGSSIRYTPGIGWFIWDGQYWKPDAEDLGMQEIAKKLPPIIATEVVHYEEPEKKNEVIKWASQAKSNSRLKASIESANSDERIVTGVDRWDGDPYLLGVENGVVDLRSGELLKGRPDLHITKRASVGYTQGLRNVRWEQFVDFATGGDKELQDWLQRAAGYTLTGLNTQDVMFLVYGPPGSGKNTFVEALVKALDTKEYSWPLDSSILAQGDGQSSSTDLYHWAELRGRRMVWVDELPESERMKENSVKKLTGSSEISARSPGEKPFTFQSQAKLWITTNHRPQINDDAMWRRMRPVPWINVPENPDPDLKAYLFDPEGGLPAVLSWMVEGAIKYLSSGARDPLGWCSAVREASDIYRKNEDRIGMFLNEETKDVEGSTLPVKSLYSIYRMWAEDRGERPMTQIAFQRKLSDRGLKIIGQGTHAEIGGMTLIPRSVPVTSEVDWGNLARFNKF